MATKTLKVKIQPVDSDLMIAIKLARGRRDRTLEELNLLIQNGILKEDIEKINNKIEAILIENESIKLMEDAILAVRAYRLNLEDTK
jgi:hypothetical protein